MKEILLTAGGILAAAVFFILALWFAMVVMEWLFVKMFFEDKDE